VKALQVLQPDSDRGGRRDGSAVDQLRLSWLKKYLVKASAPAGVWARAPAGMLGSTVGVAVVVGAAAVVAEGAAVLESDVLEGVAPGLASPAQPASNIEAARGAATSAARVLFTVALCPALQRSGTFVHRQFGRPETPTRRACAGFAEPLVSTASEP
jgi:hypothetical protein